MQRQKFLVGTRWRARCILALHAVAVTVADRERVLLGAATLHISRTAQDQGGQRMVLDYTTPRTTPAP